MLPASLALLAVQRILSCKSQGYKAVAFRTMEGYLKPSETGFTPPITQSDYVAYILFLANYTRAQDMGVGLKDVITLIDNTFISYFDFALSVGCAAANTCNAYSPYRAGEFFRKHLRQ